MLAAAAAADITPPPGAILQGHWGTTPSHGVLYPLELRAIVFRNDHQTLALITLDVIGIERDTTEAIRDQIHRRCAIAPSNVLLAASHTHCGPPMLRSLGGRPDGAYIDRVTASAVEAVAKALTRLEPVALALGCASAHFNVNRRPLPGITNPVGFSVNFGGIVDRRVRVLRVDSAGGHPLAVLFHYSCHPTTMRGSDGLISPDYPGVARARIEAALGCRAMFLPGCFGNIRPLLLDESGSNFAYGGKRELDAAGNALASAVINAVAPLRTRSSDHLWSREINIEIPFAPPPPRERLMQMLRETTPAAVAVKHPWAGRALERLERGEHPSHETSRMTAMQIGPLGIVTIPGEPVQEIGHAIERNLADLPDLHDLWPIGYTNDMVGYLCTAEHHAQGGYEPNAYIWFDRPAAFEREEPTLVAAAKQLWEQSGRNHRSER